MAVKVKPLDKIAANWQADSTAHSADYKVGALAAGADWEKNTAAQAGAYKGGVSAPDIEKRFAGGVHQAGAEKYERKVSAVGESRFIEGVNNSLQDYKEGFAPFVEEIERQTLPARQPRGAPANKTRSGIIGDALNKKRLAMQAAGR